MVSQIYPSELQINKVNTSDTEAAFSDLHLSISNDIVSTKIYGKGLTSWLSFVVSAVSLSLSHWYPGSGVVLDCIDS